jgi:hypothetical protein
VVDRFQTEGVLMPSPVVSVPHDRDPDSTIALWSDGYTFSA